MRIEVYKAVASNSGLAPTGIIGIAIFPPTSSDIFYIKPIASIFKCIFFLNYHSFSFQSVCCLYLFLFSSTNNFFLVSQPLLRRITTPYLMTHLTHRIVASNFHKSLSQRPSYYCLHVYMCT